jgi:Cu/Ag efflux pump CusA
VTAAALLPVVFIGDVPGTEIAHPLAVVALGGLVTTTLVTLFAVPVLCARPWLGGVEQEEPALAPGAPRATGAV